MNAKIVKVEEILYETQPGGEPVIGFNIHYDDGVVYPIGPVLLRAELDAILQMYGDADPEHELLC